MWYLLRCSLKSEELFLKECRENVDGNILSGAFIFTYDRMRKYLGEWHHEKKNLFPGCIFLESDDIQDAKKVKECYSRIAETSGERESLRMVFAEEQELLRRLSDERHHVAMSRGVIRSGKTVVTEGPLTGQEGLIARIDRHKRVALLKSPVLVEGGSVQVGLEIMEKI